LSAEKPLHVLCADAVVVVKKPPNPYRSGHRILRGADFFSLKVLWFLDARIDIVVDGRVPEKSRREYRNTHERSIASTHDCYMVGKGHIRCVEFPIMSHAPKDFFRLQRNVVEFDPFGLHRAVLK